jgi:hypothetical protein
VYVKERVIYRHVMFGMFLPTLALKEYNGTLFFFKKMYYVTKFPWPQRINHHRYSESDTIGGVDATVITITRTAVYPTAGEGGGMRGAQILRTLKSTEPINRQEKYNFVQMAWNGRMCVL